MKFDTRIIKNGRSFYVLIPKEMRVLFKIEKLMIGELNTTEKGFVITFEFPKNETNTVCKKD